MATAAQIAVFAGWHSPAALASANAAALAHTVMQPSLLAVATAFWLAVILHVRKRRWSTVFALLVTGKTFCLIAALMVFAPRFLYGPAAIEDATGSATLRLADQQFAGLLMLIACPLTYVLASVCIVCDWFFKYEHSPSPKSIAS